MRRNKATNPSALTDPFSAATKTLVLGNLFKLVRSAITFARAVCIGGNEENTRRLSYFPRLHLYPQVANFPCECDEAKAWINYQVQGFYISAAEKWMFNILDLMAIFLLKTETCDAKNCWVFFVDAIFCFVKIGSEKRWTNSKQTWWMEVL